MPKSQSALLEAMAEKQVTVEGVTRRLEEPFLVMATENPIEQEGTFPLPEAQLDRFAAKLALGYPSLDDEVRIVEEQRHAHPLESVEPVVTGRELMDIRLAAERVYIDPIVLRWLVELVRATRHLDQVSVGASVRASLALERAARAWALAHGRSFVDPEDVERLFIPVVAHRLVFEPFALAVEGMESGGSLLDSVRAECLKLAPPPQARLDGTRRRRGLRSRRLARRGGPAASRVSARLSTPDDGCDVRIATELAPRPGRRDRGLAALRPR